MNTISRIVVSLLAVLGVGALGYYAYTLSSETLTFPFAGTDRQKGLSLEAIVSPPSLTFGKREEPLLDIRALEDSLESGGVRVSTVSGEYRVIVNGGYISVSSPYITKGSGAITINSDTYNDNKTTKYRLPRDIVLTPSDIPRDFSLSSSASPRDQLYDISMYGMDEYSPEDIRYFVHYSSGLTCSVSASWGTDMLPPYYPSGKPVPTLSGEPVTTAPIPVRDMTTKWLFREIHPTIVSPFVKAGQISKMTIRLPYEKSENRLCIVAGVNGVYRTIEDRTLDPFVATASTLDTLSPEYDMKSQVEFDFSTPIYSDSGTLYSPEYIANRHSAKIHFLKHLDVPGVAVSVENLTLTPDRAILTLPLEEGKKYTFSLRDIEDIYGRISSVEHEVEVKSEPFLSVKLADNRSIYKKGEKVSAKLYALQAKKPSYSLKLCKTNLETYARLERMVTSPEASYNKLIADTLNNPKETSLCLKKDIVIAKDGYVSPFLISDFQQKGSLDTGLYILSLSDTNDIVDSTKFFRPIIFSVVDTNITMKVDASGKIMILATDVSTGAPLAGQNITVMRNISRTYTESWNDATSQTVRTYLPLSSQAFAPGVSLGRTDAAGFLQVSLDTLKDSSGYDSTPYGLSFESWWDYEGRYDSFIVKSDAGDRLGYLVSTWNDGITGYNFGIKDSDYSYTTRPGYTAYLHADRKLYLPGEKVYLHAILRKNSKTLEIPTEGTFDLVISDPMGREIRRTTLKANEFGSISTEYDLPKDASLGSYNVNITNTRASEYVENGFTNFQVEVFKNPTFTASVTLKSPDLEGESLRNLRKESNTDPYSPWISDVYKGDFNIEGIVKAKYYNGAEMRNTSYTYRVYRSDYYDDSYWGDCFWGCYYEPPIEFYTEGTGTIEADGYGIFRVPVEYSSFYSDYKYTVEITIRDPLSGETVTTPGTLLVKLPAEYKSFSPDNPLTFTPKKKILSPNDTLAGEMKPEYGKWDKSLAKKYHYEIIQRSYTETWVDDIRAGQVRVTSPVDTSVASGTVDDKDFSYRFISALPGEYHMKITPVTPGALPPEESIFESIFYISGENMTLRDSTLRVIPEKTVYKMGETARVLIQVPFTGATLLITKEKGGVIDKEYVTLSGNTLSKNIAIDDSVVPNVYIGVVAFLPNAPAGARSYAVAYGELVVDIAEKKSLLTLIPDKTTYKNRDNVNLDLTLTDRSGNPLQGEVTLMVVDESLIRLLGNIDLDMIPKFYQKFPFTVKTSLSLIGLERNRFLSRKGSNGGSGDKGGGGVEIASRTIFKNTAYYNPSVRTDASGKAKVSFALPDNITDYRIIAVSSTRDSRFGVAEKTIEVRKDYVLEAHLPMIARNGDTFTTTVSAFNNTKRITPTTVIMKIGTLSGQITKESTLSLDINTAKSVDFAIAVPPSWKGNIPYTIELREGSRVLDSITKSLSIPDLPIVGRTSRVISVFTGATTKITLPKISDPNTDLNRSTVDISVSTSYASQMQEAIKSLLQYPYGCVEQTISSTLPNAIALSLRESVGVLIDEKQARENTEKGLAKILRMQHYSGGWTYWEGALDANAYITPYVIRSLLTFRELGLSVPQTSIDAGVSYIIANDSVYAKDPDGFAEAVWALAASKNEQAAEWWKRIDPNLLSPHGYIAYAYAAHELGRYTPQIEKNLENKMNRQPQNSYWYWSSSADKALYIRLLFDRGDTARALLLLDPLVRNLDVSSYYVSTQEKLQLFLALAKEAKIHAIGAESISLALRGDALISDMSLSKEKSSNRISSTRTKIGDTISLSRDANGIPLYVSLMITDKPKDIMTLPAYSTGGITVTRTFEEIDESRGVDENGEYLMKKPVTDGAFKKGNLYRVTLTAKLPAYKEASWNHLTIEDFLPGAWRPIRGIFQTESVLEKEAGDSWWWDYTEARDDRILANMSYGYGDMRTYSYYFRPESIGEYILPPTTAYFMYRPEVHSYTKYEKIKITQ